MSPVLKGLGWFLLAVLGLLAIVASAFIQGAFETHKGYVQFVQSAGRVGWLMLITAIVVLLGSVVAMSIYTIRRGKADSAEGKVVSDGPMTMGLDVPMGRSRRKMLLSRHEFISVESLLDGTATFGERMMALGIAVMNLSFFFICLGASLLIMKRFLLFSVVFPIPAGLIVYYFARGVWADYGEAKGKLLLLQRGDREGATAEESRELHGHRIKPE